MPCVTLRLCRMLSSTGEGRLLGYRHLFAGAMVLFLVDALLLELLISGCLPSCGKPSGQTLPLQRKPIVVLLSYL